MKCTPANAFWCNPPAAAAMATPTRAIVPQSTAISRKGIFRAIGQGCGGQRQMNDFDRSQAMTQSMQRVATIALAAAIFFGSVPGRAQEHFPSHTVKLVVPAAGGSTTDTLARI